MLTRRNYQIALIVLTSLLIGCNGSVTTRQRVEAETAPFNPAYFMDETKRHWAVPFDVVHGELELADRPIEERPGPLRYFPPGAGNTTVIYRDMYGGELGRYQMEDPTQTRSCDFDQKKSPAKKRGRPRGGKEKLKGGQVDILVPADARIAQIEVITQEVGRHDVRGHREEKGLTRTKLPSTLKKAVNVTR